MNNGLFVKSWQKNQDMVVIEVYQDELLRLITKVDGSNEYIEVYIGENFDQLIKTIYSEEFPDSNMMKLKVISRMLLPSDISLVDY